MSPEDIISIGTSIAASLGISGLIVISLSSWLGKVWAGRILEKDRAKYASEISIKQTELNQLVETHKVGLAHKSIVLKARFDHEYAIYKDLWANISVLQYNFRNLYAISALVPDDDRTDKTALVNETAQMLLKVQACLEDNKPFYPREIWQRCVILMASFGQHLYNGGKSQTPDPKLLDRLNRYVEIHTSVNREIDDMCESLRSRIESISTIEG